MRTWTTRRASSRVSAAAGAEQTRKAKAKYAARHKMRITHPLKRAAPRLVRPDAAIVPQRGITSAQLCDRNATDAAVVQLVQECEALCPPDREIRSEPAAQ